MSSILQLAESIARKAHDCQTRRDGVTPYLVHIQSVLNAVSTDDEKAVAWLHDVLEDTDITTSDLYNAGIWAHIVEAVKVMTKEEGEPYGAYINRVKVNPLARVVKIADMRHNLSDDPTPRQRAKYAAALDYLMTD